MTDSDREGVIKFRLEYSPGELPSGEALPALNAVRQQLIALNILGQDPVRYEGLGFGNISCRTAGDAFIVTGSQTGHIPALNDAHYAWVTRSDPAHNALWATGQTRPSSESLSHAVIYQTRREIGGVIHVHDPLLWQQSENWSLPCIPMDIPYGTPEMAWAIQRLLQTTFQKADTGVFAMLGHKDGIIAFGPTLALALAALQDNRNRAAQHAR